MTATAIPLRFQVGARTLAAVPRRLVRVALSLDEVLGGVLGGAVPTLPPLDAADGYLVTSLPEALVPVLPDTGLLMWERQRYRRYHADLLIGYDAWLAAMSGNARSSLKRKAKKLAQGSEIRRYRTPAEMAEFHPLARPLAERTYQERLLGSGLPADPAFLQRMYRLAAEDRARAWLLVKDGVPVAYLWCSAEGQSLRYDYVGHDPALGDLSPGTVLHAEAMRDLFAERRFARFDFTEGEGQHKRQFATGSTPCVDLLLLRPTLANRALVAALRGWESALGVAKRWAAHPRLAALAKRVRRA